MFLLIENICLSRAAYHTLLKLVKLLLTVMGYGQVAVVAEAIRSPADGSLPTTISVSVHNAAVVLQQALQHIPNPNLECVLRNVAMRLGQHMSKLVRM